MVQSCHKGKPQPPPRCGLVVAQMFTLCKLQHTLNPPANGHISTGSSGTDGHSGVEVICEVCGPELLYVLVWGA